MKLQPILLSPEITREIKEGNRTQFRKVVKPQPEVIDRSHPSHGLMESIIWEGKEIDLGDFENDYCPYGQPGDRLWMARRVVCEITGIRVERLQDITRKDIEAEGVRLTISEKNTVHAYRVAEHLRSHFAERWDSTSGKRGWPWDMNPLVWVVELNLCE